MVAPYYYKTQDSATIILYVSEELQVYFFGSSGFRVKQGSEITPPRRGERRVKSF
jgi:hypothetical protein